MADGRDSFRPCNLFPADIDELQALAEMKMPFGRYQGTLLIDLPERYVIWLAGNGFPDGRLGRMLETVHTIKVNGLEYLFGPLRSNLNNIRHKKK